MQCYRFINVFTFSAEAEAAAVQKAQPAKQAKFVTPTIADGSHESEYEAVQNRNKFVHADATADHTLGVGLAVTSLLF